MQLKFNEFWMTARGITQYKTWIYIVCRHWR